MSTKSALLALAGLYVFALLAAFGPPAVESVVSATIFGF